MNEITKKYAAKNKAKNIAEILIFVSIFLIMPTIGLFAFTKSLFAFAAAETAIIFIYVKLVYKKFFAAEKKDFDKYARRRNIFRQRNYV